MIKYKNLFLAAICIAAGTLAIMTNLHKPSKNMVKSTTKLNNRYETESIITNMKEANINIKNLNFSLNDNSNSLSKIVLKSEESVFGFKSIYTLATVPHKIIKSTREISNNNKNEEKNNIKISSEIKNIKTAFVANETISYSNYIRAFNKNIISPTNFGNITSNNNAMLFETHNKTKKIESNIVTAAVIGTLGTITIGMGIAVAYKLAPNAKSCINGVQKIAKRITDTDLWNKGLVVMMLPYM